MKNYEDEIFEFGNGSIDESEQPNNDFNYDSISGLGESNYENDDLFKPENDSIVDDQTEKQEGFNFEVEDYGTDYQLNEVQNNTNENSYYPENSDSSMYEDIIPVVETTDNVNEDDNNDSLNDTSIDYKTENLVSDNDSVIKEGQENPIESEIEISETPIEELKSLTDFKEDNIEKMDINELFDKVSVNVKGASEIFKRNTEMKEKIDTRFEELKKLQAELENSKKSQIDEINSYKDEVFNKLTEKKEEIEKRLNTLKDLQASLEKEKSEFEEYRKSEQDKIEKIQKDVQSAYDDRREELSHIEDTLRKQKDALDEERNQLSLDKIQYESEKNELANNILKFNELVDTFTTGVNGVTE